MSLQPCLRSLASSSRRLSRIASLLSNEIAYTDSRSSRTSSSQHCNYIPYSVRHITTTTEYKPYSLDSVPPLPPPRNNKVPDTSITDTQLEADTIAPASLSSPNARRTDVDRNLTSNISLPEIEAQKSKPVVQDPPPKKSRLRPRKAAMSLTESAVSQLRALLDQPDPKMIRVGVKNRGCSGLAYHLEYVDKAGTFDETVNQDGVKVLVDSKALFSIIGSEMDWVSEKLGERFVFRNPNIKEQCGCGESFMV